MRRVSTACLLLALCLAHAGCGESNEAVTDPTKLTPLTDDQKKAIRAADDEVAAEENANPTRPTKGKAASK